MNKFDGRLQKICEDLCENLTGGTNGWDRMVIDQTRFSIKKAILEELVPDEKRCVICESLNITRLKDFENFVFSCGHNVWNDCRNEILENMK